MSARSIGLAVSLYLATTTAAVAEPPAMAPIHQYVRGFDSGDPQLAIGAFSDDAVIVDEDPPRIWRGSRAASRWVADVQTNWAKLGVSEMRSRIGTPIESDINDQDAYVVVPEALDYKLQGAPMCLHGDHVFVVRKEPGGWKIAASAMATRDNQPGICSTP